jgi:1-deoxy-D-xylulose-5-phosphate reductoisomerase
MRPQGHNGGVDSAQPAPRDIVLLGSTGSVGTQAADIIRRNPGRFRVTGLAAGGGDPGLLASQAIEFGAEVVAVASETAAPALREALRAAAAAPPRPAEPAEPGAGGPAGRTQAGRTQAGGGPAGRTQASRAAAVLPKILAGPDAVAEVAAWPCDIVLNAVTGAVGLAATLAAIDAGRTLALANKESLIMGGQLVAGRAAPGQIVPVDSEHSAIAQCLRSGQAGEVRRLILTASGGPFLHRSRAELADVTPQQALAHPTWNMGPVITVNSATLVNKGLELIEAHLLFGVGFEDIEVVVHRQSVVHSMVEFTDGSTIAQASPPDMGIPIAVALGWPDRVPGAARPVDWTAAHTWTFEPLDTDAFPAVALARQAGIAGGTAPAAYNAANEECVAAFLSGRLPFAGITDTVSRVVSEHSDTSRESVTLDDVLATDRWARDRARELTTKGQRRGPAAAGAG